MSKTASEGTIWAVVAKGNENDLLEKLEALAEENGEPVDDWVPDKSDEEKDELLGGVGVSNVWLARGR